MFQPEHIVETPGAQEAAGKFNPGEVIIEHVSNSSIDHPLIHLPKVFGVDLSVTKHVLMVWVVAALVFFVVTLTVRRYLRQDRRIPSGFMNALEFFVVFLGHVR
jgi:F-type H+-transporting ATPase subunit a